MLVLVFVLLLMLMLVLMYLCPDSCREEECGVVEEAFGVFTRKQKVTMLRHSRAHRGHTN